MGHVKIFSMHYIAILPNLLKRNEVKIIPEIWEGVIRIDKHKVLEPQDLSLFYIADFPFFFDGRG